MKRAAARLNALTLAKLVRYLQDVPSNVYDLAEASGLSPSTTRGFVLALERERAIHVVEWEVDKIGRACRKVYAFGQGKSAPKPPARKDAPGYTREAQRRQRRQAAQIRVQNALAGIAA